MRERIRGVNFACLFAAAGAAWGGAAMAYAQVVELVRRSISMGRRGYRLAAERRRNTTICVAAS